MHRMIRIDMQLNENTIHAPQKIGNRRKNAMFRALNVDLEKIDPRMARKNSAGIHRLDGGSPRCGDFSAVGVIGLEAKLRFLVPYGAIDAKNIAKTVPGEIFRKTLKNPRIGLVCFNKRLRVALFGENRAKSDIRAKIENHRVGTGKIDAVNSIHENFPVGPQEGIHVRNAPAPFPGGETALPTARKANAVQRAIVAVGGRSQQCNPMPNRPFEKAL